MAGVAGRALGWMLACTAAGALAAPEPGAGNPAGQARTKLGDLQSISGQLRKQAGEDAALATFQDDLVRLDETAREAAALLEQAEVDAAGAWVKMACYTAWIVSRESKKKAASLRLIELTRATGRAGEVERYQARHEMVLDTIQDATERYAAILSELEEFSDPAVEKGFTRHEQDLIKEGLAERIRVLNTVRKHRAQLPGDDKDLVTAWQRDLEEL